MSNRPFLVVLLIALSGCGRIELLSPHSPVGADESTRPGLVVLAPPRTSPVVPVADASPCSADSDCGDARLCRDGRCTGCPDLSDCTPPPPELGLETVIRNGCTLCDFAPRSACEVDGDCPVAGQHCYRGLRCREGCEGAGCCVNGCAAPGCPESVPIGCRLPAPFCPYAGCLITSCSCADDQAWRCAADAADVTSSCEYVP